MIDMAEPTWTIESLAYLPNGEVQEAVLVCGEKRVRLVEPTQLLDQVARMDPMGRLIGSAVAEMFAGVGMPRVLRNLRTAEAAATVAFQESGGSSPTPAIPPTKPDLTRLVKARRKRSSDGNKR